MRIIVADKDTVRFETSKQFAYFYNNDIVTFYVERSTAD